MDVTDNIVVLRGEQATWELLERALSKDPELEDVEVKFSGWPKLEITVRGRNLDGTIPSRYLPALQECQESIYRIYSYSKYREFSTRRITDAEKRQLELTYKVEKGSSEFGAQIADALQKIGTEAATRMTPMQLTVFLCLCALLFTGHSGFKHWLKYKENKLRHDESKVDKEVTGRAIEALADSNRLIAQASTANATRDSERDALLKKAVSSTKAARLAYEGASTAYTRLALSMDPEDTMVVGGAELLGVKLRSAVTTPRQASEPFDQAGPAVFRSVENNFKKGYVVSVRFIEDDIYLTTSIEKTRLTPEETACLSEAIFSGKAVWAHIEGKWKRGDVTGAKLLSVRKLEGPERSRVSKALGGTKADI